MLIYNCSYPKCNLRIVVTRVVWHEIDKDYKPFCCRACISRYMQERKNETLADQNEAGETASEVLASDFIKHHNALDKTKAKTTLRQLRLLL